MHPLFGFLCWNMSDHLAHQMSPTVPFHALPAPREEPTDQPPAAYDGLVPTYRQTLRTF
jgi:fatty acid desaturase